MNCGRLIVILPDRNVSTSSSQTGDVTTYTTGGGPTFNMITVDAGLEFKQGMDDNGNVFFRTAPATAIVENVFEIGQTEVTYELWSAVYDWATHPDRGANQYTFANPGIIGSNDSGSNQQPVTTVNWRDSIVWCNALTEYYNAQEGQSLECVYYADETYSSPLRVSTNNGTITYTTAGSQDYPYIKAESNSNTDMANCTAKGFRLPTTIEWRAAARWKGSDNSDGAYEFPVGSGNYWTPGDYASGGTGPYTGDNLTDYPNFNPFGWYVNSTSAPDGNTVSTQPVAGKTANALELYDMSGNVYEMNFEWYPGFNNIRVGRSGAWVDGTGAQGSQIGLWGYTYPYDPRNPT